MPRKGGALTPSEKAIAKAMAETNDIKYAAYSAGLSPISGGAHRAAQRPAVMAEIARQQQELLFSEILPLALKVHKEILADPKAPAGARVQAVKLAYDRTLGAEGAGQSKEPHEMTADEIAEAIAKLEQVAADRARPVSASTIVDVPPAEPELFG